MKLIFDEMPKSILEPTCDFIGRECDVEMHLIDNIDKISIKSGWGKVKEVRQQYSLPISTKERYRVDIFLIHEDGTGTLIEVKSFHRKNRGSSSLQAVSQLCLYGSLIENTFGAMPRLVIAAPSVSDEVFSMIQRFNLPIDFLMADGNRFIFLNTGVKNSVNSV